jgi:GntR family transcriptional regulator/MocR family aminotransferase
MLVNPGEAVWFENPGAIGARNAFRALDARLVPVEIDSEGFSVDDARAKAPEFRLAFVTPSHQQPLGHVMSLGRRLALLQAAKDADAMIVEDDYDGEFYYGDQPPPTLKSIDTQERVIYVGTFSKSLFPSLRLGFILSPSRLVESFERIFGTWQSGAPTASQAIVAEFMEEGFFATHVRTMRQLYKERYEALFEAGAAIADLIDVQPTHGGFHTIGLLPETGCEERIVEAARDAGIITAPLGRYVISPIQKSGLVLGFGSTPPEDIRNAANTLGKVLRQVCGGRKLV